MATTIQHISAQVIRKAKKSPCRHKVAAIALNRKDEILGIKYNISRPQEIFNKKGGGIHAERLAIMTWGKSIKTLIICRVNKTGDLIPIHPCKNCQKMADKLGIKIQLARTSK